MTFQSNIYQIQSFGNVGELYSDAPYVVEPYILNSSNINNNVYGRFFTTASNTEGIVKAGGALIGTLNRAAGFLVNTKVNASYGTQSGGPLDSTLNLANGVTGEFLTRGFIYVNIVGVPAGNINIGDGVFYNQTDGSLAVMTTGIVFPGYTFAYARIEVYDPVTLPGLAVIEVFDFPYKEFE